MNKEEIIKRALIILHTTGYTNELEKSLCIDAIEQLQQENKQLKDRIDKAIEYIKNNSEEWEFNIYGTPKILMIKVTRENFLKMLKGDE